MKNIIVASTDIIMENCVRIYQHDMPADFSVSAHWAYLEDRYGLSKYMTLSSANLNLLTDLGKQHYVNKYISRDYLKIYDKIAESIEDVSRLTVISLSPYIGEDLRDYTLQAKCRGITPTNFIAALIERSNLTTMRYITSKEEYQEILPTPLLEEVRVIVEKTLPQAPNLVIDENTELYIYDNPYVFPMEMLHLIHDNFQELSAL